MIWAVLLIGVAIFYVGWHLSLTSWSRLRELGIEHERNSTTYFDTILWSLLLGLIVARIAWMGLHAGLYAEVPWGIFPYVKTVNAVDWFTFFPWRIFKLTEGISYPVLWSISGILSAMFIFIPTMSLARKLKLEKRGIMRGFLIKSIVGFVLTIAYFSGLVWLSLQ